ncbi:MAG: 4'-phosphopantetheinyl transferase superfamily protein [Chitinophagales bacterium]|nr:4'-phosphopantetheinyl transferase superfamily protein [Chitinophagales bacterium]
MPLFREWSSDKYSLAAIWKIEEPESFFTERTGITSDIKNEKRRMERLAGRFLLKYLKNDFPLLNIQPDEHDKPRVDNNHYFFSISHSWPYVAAVVSPYVEAGIDIQCWHPRMEMLQNKFLSAREQQFFNNDTELITLAWSAKEAAYKWQGRRGVEFVDHLIIQSYSGEEYHKEFDIQLLLTSNKLNISAQGIVKEDFACAYIIHEEIVHPQF